MQDCVFVKKKPQAAWDFENIPRARKMNNAECKIHNAKLKGVKLCARGGKVWCDGRVFEGEDALRAAFEHIGILAFLRCGKVLSCK